MHAYICIIGSQEVPYHTSKFPQKKSKYLSWMLSWTIPCINDRNASCGRCPSSSTTFEVPHHNYIRVPFNRSYSICKKDFNILPESQQNQFTFKNLKPSIKKYLQASLLLPPTKTLVHFQSSKLPHPIVSWRTQTKA